MLRTSRYTIYVDLPDDRTSLLLVHGYTGAFDRVSRRVACYLRAHESGRPPKPLYGEWSTEPEIAADSEPPPAEVLTLLQRRGYLTPLAPDAEESLFARLAEKLHERARQQAPSYIFMPTYDCNLRCGYCFQDHLRTDVRFRPLLRAMTPEIVDRIFRALPGYEARLGTAGTFRRNIGLFGGEPLLAANRPIVERILEHARALGPADFWAVTNGTELAAYRDLLGPGSIARLQITLDGPSREHDRRRIYADGSGSFARIAANLTLALELGAEVSIRLNLDRDNLADLPELALEIHAYGWAQQRGFSVYTAPINAINEKTDRARTMNSWELDQALTAMREQDASLRIIGRPDEKIRARARKVFADGEEVLPVYRPSFCGAHDRMVIFDPLGNLYACWEKTADERIRIGRVTEASEIELVHEEFALWRSRSVASNPVCRRCRYALHCGGGCAVHALGQRGKFHANYCDGFASRFRASVAEAWRAHVGGEEEPSGTDRVCDL